MTRILHIEGASINDIASLYVEINRVFMADEDWQLGASLDALDDLLHGGYGALAGHAIATVVWLTSPTAAMHWAAKPRAPGCSRNSLRAAGSTVRPSTLS